MPPPIKHPILRPGTQQRRYKSRTNKIKQTCQSRTDNYQVFIRTIVNVIVGMICKNLNMNLHGSLSLLSCRLGDLGTTWILLLYSLDDSNSHSLAHVPHSKTTKWRILRESLHHHGLGWNHLHDPCITILQKLGLLLNLLTRSPVNLGHELGKLHGNVAGVAVKHWSITITNLT